MALAKWLNRRIRQLYQGTIYMGTSVSTASLHNSKLLFLKAYHSAFQEYIIVPNLDNIKKIERFGKLPWSAYLGVCGMPGMCFDLLS